MRRALCTLVAAAAVCTPADARPSGGDVNDSLALVYAQSVVPSEPEVRLWDLLWTNAGPALPYLSDVSWQVARHNPERDEITIASLGTDGSLKLQRREPLLWGPVSVVASSCGVAATRAFDAQYERTSGDLLLAYRKASDSLIYYRTMDAAGLTTELPYAGLGLDSAPLWIELAPRRHSDSMVLLAATATRLYAAVWDGSGFSNPITLTSSLAGDRRAWSGAFLSRSGRALVVWAETTGSPRYRLWTGTAWGASGGTPGGSTSAWWLKLAADPRGSSDQALMCWTTAAREAEAAVWNGSGWTGRITPETDLEHAAERRIDAAYSSSGVGLLAWHRRGEKALRSRTWDGSGWSAETLGPTLNSLPQAIVLGAGPERNQVTAALRHRPAVLTLADFVVYSESGSVDTGSAEVMGLVGASEPGVALPLPPIALPGTTDLTYPNNATATIAPGSYRKLTTGNSCTLRFGAGTYVFTEYRGGNNGTNTTTFEADTTGGDIDLIFTSGGFDVRNNLVVKTTGAGSLSIHVLNGDFVAKNNADITAVIFAYNGNIEIEKNSGVVGRLYAEGDISVGSGVIEGDITEGPPGQLSTLTWTDGAPGTATTHTPWLPGWTRREPFGLSGPVSPVRITRWREIEPE